MSNLLRVSGDGNTVVLRTDGGRPYAAIVAVRPIDGNFWDVGFHFPVSHRRGELCDCDILGGRCCFAMWEEPLPEGRKKRICYLIELLHHWFPSMVPPWTD